MDALELSDDPRVGELLSRYVEEHALNGRELDAEELCRDSPELLAPLRERIARYRRLHGLLAPPAPIGEGTTLSHYVLGKRLGGGGMGVVYQAEDTRLRRKVAIKLLVPQLSDDPSAKARFLREARAAATLDHPNIAVVYDVGESPDGRMFLAMAFYAGETIKKKIERGPLPIAESLDLAEQIARGLAAAHGRGIVHRDVKPANVMVTESGEAKIVDFGLAKLTGESGLTRAGGTPGTVAYMAPEQLRGEEADQRSDLWSLGVVLHEMVAGRRPFGGDNEVSAIQAILNEEPRPLTEVCPDCPPALQTLVAALLDRDRGSRPADAANIAQSLAKLRKGRDLPETLPKVASAQLALGIASPAPRLRPWRGIRSLAVLPLHNLSGDPDQEIFSTGMTDVLTTELGKISSLAITGSRSSMRFKRPDIPLSEIADQLKVDAFLLGSVIRSGQLVRISLQLTTAREDRLIWSESYERQLADFVSLQGEIARAVAREIRVELSPDEERRLNQHRRVDPAALEAYLVGAGLLERFRHLDSLPHFERAIAIDPSFADAFASLAWALLYGGTRGVNWADKEAAVPRARRLIEQALALDPESSEAQRALGWLRYYWDWDAIGADASLRRAVALNPNSVRARISLGIFLVFQGRLDEGVEQIETAQRLDPASLDANIFLVLAYALSWQPPFGRAERWEKGVAGIDLILQLDPSFQEIFHCRALFYAATGLWDEALADCDRYTGHKDIESCGPIYALTGQRDKALARLEQCRTESGLEPLSAAGIYAGLGEIDEALGWFETAVQQRGPLLIAWMRYPMLADRLRADPRFKEVERRIGLPHVRPITEQALAPANREGAPP